MKTAPLLTYEKPGKYESSRLEKIHNLIFDNSVTGSIAVANEIAILIKAKQQQIKTS